MKKLMMAIVAGMFAFAASAVETSIAYQGVLKDSTGAHAITGQRNIEFCLYDVATGGRPLWGRSVMVLLDDTGLFNVELADATGSIVATAANEYLADALKAARNSSLYVGLTVQDSSGEIQPRQKILMTPYSSWAADVTNASGDFNVDGKATLKSAEVTGEFTVTGKTTLAGQAEFSQGVTISGALNVKNTGSLSGYGTIPVGGIIMWSGVNVPDGWALCNGSNGTPDLRGRFVMGVSSLNQINGTGGSEKVTLSVGNLPSHSHLYAGDDMLTRINGSGYNAGSHVESTPGNYDANSTGSGGGTVYRTSSTGNGEAFSVLPPYYRLAYIMRVK